VSKRHQSSRRRSYGRRQHELHERESVRRDGGFGVDLDLDQDDRSPSSDGVAFLDAGALRPRLRYALGD
jgi:hypothetical protein